ncbi:hypothetical protein [Planosporangium flavigriseum]|uniref:hypothetical protein n=1 Tax=Planosporangium flavigriseum TaxID=373681 RepID=UPI00194E7DF2|nr:hypothetical protein [Planosporangium flavigriseum]
MVAKLLARWLVVIVVMPLIVAALRWLSRALEERRGPTTTSRLLRQAADALRPPRSVSTGRVGGRR